MAMVGRRRAGAARTGGAMPIRLAVGFRSAGKTVAFDRAGKTATLGNAHHIDYITVGEDVGAHHVSQGQLHRLSGAKFSQTPYRRRAGLLQMALLPLGQFALRRFLKAQLHGPRHVLPERIRAAPSAAMPSLSTSRLVASICYSS